MSTLAEIEAAVDQLPPEQKEELFTFLQTRLGPDSTGRQTISHSVLEIAPANVGGMLRPLSPEDDLLGEMLEEHA